jgi:hypothetical protein
MNLTLPTPTVTVGPAYATQNNAAFTAIDAHDHTAGKGVPVPSAGISLNADLPFNGYNATLLRTARLQSQSGALAAASDLGCLYNVNGNLYYNDGSGNQIQITTGGAVNVSSSGQITGMGGTSASVTYSSVSTKYTFWQATNISALIDSGAITIRPGTLSAHGITLAPPGSLSSDYQLTLPSGLPASTKIMTCDSSGNVGVVYDVDNSTLQVSSNTLQVKSQGITANQIANNTITRTQLAALGQQISSATSFAATAGSWTTVPNASVTITTSGRPVMIFLIPDGSASSSVVGTGFSTGFLSASIALLRGGAQIALWTVGGGVVSSSTNNFCWVPCGSVLYLDPVSAGTYTYTLQVEATNGSPQINVSNCKLVAFEIF